MSGGQIDRVFADLLSSEPPLAIDALTQQAMLDGRRRRNRRRLTAAAGILASVTAVTAATAVTADQWATRDSIAGSAASTSASPEGPAAIDTSATAQLGVPGMLRQLLEKQELRVVETHGFTSNPSSAPAFEANASRIRGGYNVKTPSGGSGSVDVQVTRVELRTFDSLCRPPSCHPLTGGGWLRVSRETVPNHPTLKVTTVAYTAPDGMTLGVTARNYPLTADGDVDPTAGGGELPLTEAALQAIATQDVWSTRLTAGTQP